MIVETIHKTWVCPRVIPNSWDGPASQNNFTLPLFSKSGKRMWGKEVARSKSSQTGVWLSGCVVQSMLEKGTSRPDCRLLGSMFYLNMNNILSHRKPVF